jgi:PKD repeat protein
VSIAGADDTLSIGGPSCAIAEGTDVSLSLPNDPYGNAITQWTINWDDGTPFGASSHAYGAPGTYTITALGQSSAGFFEGTTTVDITQAGPGTPAVTVDSTEYSGADTEDGGSLAPDLLHVTFNGPAAAESYNVSIDWGDGSPATTFSLSPGQTSVTNPDEAGFDYPLQQYAANGTYGIIVTVTDADGNSASNSSSPLDVTYSNSAPSNLTLSLDQSTVSAGSGEPNLSGSFTDPQPNIPHVVTVDWGDGGDTPDITTVDLAAGQTTFTAQPNSTTYATAGTYTITATVAGMDGSTTASTSVTVTAVPAEVMLGATTPVASEYLGSDAAFAITCGGGSAGDVTVNFSIATDLAAR